MTIAITDGNINVNELVTLAKQIEEWSKTVNQTIYIKIIDITIPTSTEVLSISQVTID